MKKNFFLFTPTTPKRWNRSLDETHNYAKGLVQGFNRIIQRMKFITTNFVRCAIKTCDGAEASFPLQYKDCKLELEESDFNPDFIVSMLDRLDWDAVIKVANDLGNTTLPPQKPENIDQNETMLKDLHSLLMETHITEGSMVCGNCNHVYYIKDSIASFLLPPHLAN